MEQDKELGDSVYFPQYIASNGILCSDDHVDFYKENT